MTFVRSQLHRILLSAIFTAGTALSQVQTDTTLTAQDTSRIAGETIDDFVTIEDRWNDIKPPPYELNVEGHWYDPYNQNALKGDYPIIGQNTFLVFTATVDNLIEQVRSPLSSGVSTLNTGSDRFFGAGERLLVLENLKLSLEIYHGDVAFRPRDWEIKAAAVGNLNYANTRENNAVNINVRKGDNRTDSHIGLQELSFEKHLFDVSDRYDFVSLKLGIQRFASDFRGFIFSDFNLAARLFGNAASNRIQYNVIFLPLLEKETNSELNTVFDDREQDVLIANVYCQDFFALGYTAQVSFHYSDDKPTTHFDVNGFPVRPSLLGTVRPHKIRTYYAGWAGDGHFGRMNITHAFYHAFGRDGFNPVAGQAIDVNAQMAALELSIDQDWMRFRISGFYSSGDSNPADETGKGFDAIIDQPAFAGGPFSYWNSQGLRLFGVGLVHKLSLLPSLRSSKIEGQANFVNPGLLLANVGYDAEITPKVKAVANINYLRFVATEVLQQFVNQPAVRRQIGMDFGLGLVYRPFVNNNVLCTTGLTALMPLDGFKDLYETSALQYAVLASLVLTY
jgi:hypothetical protein